MSRVYKILLIAGILGFGILLAAYVVGGSFSRYLADDYCYGTVVLQKGFFQAQVHSYVSMVPYGSDRYALTFFSGVAELLGGPRLVPILPGLAVLLWLCGSVVAVHQWGEKGNLSFSWPERILTGMGLVAFALLLAPNRYQILNWKAGMLTYLAPLVANTLILGWAAALTRKPSLNLLSGVGLFLASFVAAGFAETTAALQATAWLLALGWALLAAVRRNHVSRSTRRVLAAGLAGTLVGMLVMVASPANSIRQSNFPPPPGLVALLGMSLDNAILFLYRILRGHPIPFAVIIGLAFALAGLHRGSRPETETTAPPLRPGRLVRFVLLPAAVFLLVLACMAPTAWSMSSYPEDRGLLVASTVLVAAAGLGGWWAGELAFDLVRRWQPRLTALFVGALLVVAVAGLAYPLRSLGAIRIENRALSVRAAAWDARDQLIRIYRDRGELDPIVPALDSIAQIFELQFDDNHWVNHCAADYYGIHSIRVIEP